MLIPNNVQKTKMFQYAGASRFAYNWALAREKENYEKGGKFISDSELRKEFTKLRHSDEYAWLLNISNNVTKQAIKDACTAYKNFFKGLQKFPRFKSRKRSMPKFYQDNVKIQFSNTHVKLEGFSSSRKGKTSVTANDSRQALSISANSSSSFGARCGQKAFPI